MYLCQFIINATISTDFIDADRVIRRSPENSPFFTVIQLARSFITFPSTIFFLKMQGIFNSLPGVLDDICNPLHRVTGFFCQLMPKHVEYAITLEGDKKYKNLTKLNKHYIYYKSTSHLEWISREKFTLMTICNTGALATCSWGTALGKN
uniref:Uncharacterized protein n=1 Tax=Heterorhabditis bacteriophora TaxID=37862 RepID=A0A1I7WZA4_HETBA